MALIKKSVIALILLVPFLLGFNSIVKAYGNGIVLSEPEEDNNGADIYHSLVGSNRAYIHFSLPRYTNADNFMTSYVSNDDHEIKFFGSRDIHFHRNIFNPDRLNYSLFVIETLDSNGNYVIEYSSSDISHDHLEFQAMDGFIDVATYISKFEKPSVFKMIDGKTYRLYWVKSETVSNVTIESLPNTDGSPYSLGSYGSVDIKLVGSNLDVQITYINTYNLATMILDNKTPFENVKNAYYWTDNNNKFITMTYEEKDPVYISALPIQARPWVQTVTWNLTTNEIRSVNKVDVFAYHEKDNNRNIYTYMYMPNIVYDSLISVTAKIAYNFEWYIGGKSDVRTDIITLKSGDKNNFSPTWEKKLLYFAIIPGYSLTEIGSKLLNFDNPYMGGSLDQISNVAFPTSELVDKITGAWNETYDTSVVIDTDVNKLYRLNWGQYDEVGARNVILAENAFQFSEIVFVKDGKVNLLSFDDIILKDVVDNSLLPRADNGLLKMFIDLIKQYPMESAILAVVVILVLLFTFSGIAMPIISLLSVLLKIIATISQVFGNVLLNLMTKPWFWVISSVSLLFYYIYTKL